MTLNTTMGYPAFNYVPASLSNQQGINNNFAPFQQTTQSTPGLENIFQNLDSTLSSMPEANGQGNSSFMQFLMQLFQMMGGGSPLAMNNGQLMPQNTFGGTPQANYNGGSNSGGGSSSGPSFNSGNHGNSFGNLFRNSGQTGRSGRNSVFSNNGISRTLSSAPPSSVTNNPGAGIFGGTKLSQTQVNNARIIAEVGKNMGMSQRDIAIGIATAMQESTLENLNYGDRDSLGLFQQRPSCGWGSPKQVTDPRYAAGKFFDALKDVKNRNNMSLTKAAQTVQRSAFPNAYAKWENMATALTKEITKPTTETLTDTLIAEAKEKATSATTETKEKTTDTKDSKSDTVASKDSSSKDSKSNTVASNDSKSNDSKKSDNDSSESTA